MLQTQALHLFFDKETGKIYLVISAALFSESLDANSLFNTMHCNASICGSQQDLEVPTLKTPQGNFTFPVSAFDEVVGRLEKKQRTKRMKLEYKV